MNSPSVLGKEEKGEAENILASTTWEEIQVSNLQRIYWELYLCVIHFQRRSLFSSFPRVTGYGKFTVEKKSEPLISLSDEGQWKHRSLNMNYGENSTEISMCTCVQEEEMLWFTIIDRWKDCVWIIKIHLLALACQSSWSQKYQVTQGSNSPEDQEKASNIQCKFLRSLLSAQCLPWKTFLYTLIPLWK